MTAVITIAPVDSSHAEAVQRLAVHPAVLDTTNLPDPYPPDGARVWIEASLAKRAMGQEYCFVILRGALVVGTCGLMRVSRLPYQAEVGYWVGQPFWGLGYATSACRLALDFGFETLGLERIQSCCLIRNPASARVLEKAGLRKTHVGPSPFPKWRDTDLFNFYEITARAWRDSLVG